MLKSRIHSCNLSRLEFIREAVKYKLFQVLSKMHHRWGNFDNRSRTFHSRWQRCEERRLLRFGPDVWGITRLGGLRRSHSKQLDTTHPLLYPDLLHTFPWKQQNNTEQHLTADTDWQVLSWFLVNDPPLESAKRGQRWIPEMTRLWKTDVHPPSAHYCRRSFRGKYVGAPGEREGWTLIGQVFSQFLFHKCWKTPHANLNVWSEEVTLSELRENSKLVALIGKTRFVFPPISEISLISIDLMDQFNKSHLALLFLFQWRSWKKTRREWSPSQTQCLVEQMKMWFSDKVQTLSEGSQRRGKCLENHQVTASEHKWPSGHARVLAYVLPTHIMS